MFAFVVDYEHVSARFITKGGRGEVSPALFRKLEKSALISVIYELKLSFKVQFLRDFRRKSRRFFLAERFFFLLQMVVYRIALIPRKLSRPKKF